MGLGDLPAVICAWCGRLLAAGAGPVSHGLCADCFDRVFRDARPPTSPTNHHCTGSAGPGPARL